MIYQLMKRKALGSKTILVWKGTGKKRKRSQERRSERLKGEGTQWIAECWQSETPGLGSRHSEEPGATG